MRPSQLFSRRKETAVDFRPQGPDGPAAQLRRLKMLLSADVPPPGEIEDCDEALAYFREYTYRKIFPGTTHEQFVATDATDEGREAIDWLCAVGEIEGEHYRSQRKAGEGRHDNRDRPNKGDERDHQGRAS